MKTEVSRLTFILGIFFFASSAKSEDVPPFRVTFNEIPPPLSINGSNYSVNVLSGSFGASLWLSLKDDGILKPSGVTVGIGSMWFLTPLDTAFDAIYINTHSSFTDSFVFDTSAQTQVNLNTPFYLSFRVGSTSPVSDPNGIYGWAKLERNSSGLILLDSAVDNGGYGGYGIIVGTTVSIPEFSTFSYIAIGIVLLWARQIKTRRGTHDHDL